MSIPVLVLDVLLLAAALLLSVPAGVLFIQVMAAVWPGRRPPTPQETEAPRLPIAVLVPAHDEAAGIAPVIAALRVALTPQDRMVVVADNCGDDTAAVARAAGAEVVERSSETLRGKGYALDFGMRHLAVRPPAIVVVVDADCLVAHDALDRLARVCATTGRPAQALYLMHAAAQAGPAQRIAEFAWIVKNHVRALGYRRFGLPCQLMGTGMAFPWTLLKDAPLASGHIVEDLQLGLDLAAAGAAPIFCPSARVTSTFPSAAEGQETQRTRWEHGHLGVIAKVGPRLFATAFRRADFRLAAMALDLCVPPIAALVLGLAGVVVASALLALAGPRAPLYLSATAFALVVLAIGLAWQAFGRQAVSFADLLGAPAYALRKLPMYVRALGRRQTEWVRTRRDDRPG